MSRFVVDWGAVFHLARERVEIREEHELLSPTLLRSQTLSALHEAVHGGEIAFVTLDADLARRVEGIVATATIEPLQTA